MFWIGFCVGERRRGFGSFDGVFLTSRGLGFEGVYRLIISSFFFRVVGYRS